MVRTQVQLTEEQSATLKKIAAEKGVSVAELIRRGVDAVIIEESDSSLEAKRKRFLACAGMFSSGKSDVAERHDDYLAEIYLK